MPYSTFCKHVCTHIYIYIYIYICAGKLWPRGASSGVLGSRSDQKASWLKNSKSANLAGAWDLSLGGLGPGGSGSRGFRTLFRNSGKFLGV